jgi:hypothetical protein
MTEGKQELYSLQKNEVRDPIGGGTMTLSLMAADAEYEAKADAGFEKEGGSKGSRVACLEAQGSVSATFARFEDKSGFTDLVKVELGAKAHAGLDGVEAGYVVEAKYIDSEGSVGGVGLKAHIGTSVSSEAKVSTDGVKAKLAGTGFGITVSEGVSVSCPIAGASVKPW